MPQENAQVHFTSGTPEVKAEQGYGGHDRMARALDRQIEASTLDDGVLAGLQTTAELMEMILDELSNLEGRISPILRPSYPVPSATDPAQEEKRSSVRAQIATQEGKLRRIGEYIMSLKSRVDI